MFDVRDYYQEENEAVRESYEKTLAAIRKVCGKTKDPKSAGEKAEYYRLFNRIGNSILKFAELEEELGPERFAERSAEELAQENKSFYEEILPKHYQESYANPTYAVKLFGDRIGQALSYWYARYRQYVAFAFQHKLYEMERLNRIFLEVVEYAENNQLEYETLVEIITRYSRERTVEDMVRELKEQVSPAFGYFRDILENPDLADLRYLYKYGTFASENELKTAKFLASYPEEKIKTLSAQIAKAYVDGFKRDGKDLSSKSTVQIVYCMGQERIVRRLIQDMKAQGLEPLVRAPLSTRPNRQYDYDHRFDRALYFDEGFVKENIEKSKQTFERCADLLKAMSGVAVISKFGEKPFKPEAKPENLIMSPEQQKLLMVYQGNIAQLRNQYAPQSEISFTIISFPVPEVGENFNQIFEDILEINMLDSAKYEKLQKRIIDALDQADYVYVKGKGSNQTDIKVKMQVIKNPEKETNFLNCVADVNIPVGEVFTSPRLAGTEGVLHVAEAFLNSLRFVDLELSFKDGYISDYSCRNFDSEEENKRYIKENLLMPHETLPIGEFAIGTNTLAYVTARKHKIVDVLPVLIIEKMGPHFAIGDTCFSRAEDIPVFNSDGKEVIARENEHSTQRKTDPQKAYTNKHTDITLPYDSIERITVVTKEGERINIIKDGRFVLPGVEELNEPLDEHA
jgi:aminopeptidase